MDGMLYLPLTTHGGMDAVGSFYGLFIGFHAFPTVVCHIRGCDDFLPSSPSYVFLPIRLFPDSMVTRQRGYLNICSSILHIDF